MKCAYCSQPISGAMTMFGGELLHEHCRLDMQEEMDDYAAEFDQSDWEPEPTKGEILRKVAAERGIPVVEIPSFSLELEEMLGMPHEK